MRHLQITISPRLKKVLRDIGGNKTRTLLVVASIAVGVCAVGAMLTVQDVLAREMDRNWQASKPASGEISMQSFEQDFVNAIRKMPELSEAEGRDSVNTRAQVGADWKAIQLFAVHKFDAQRLNVFTQANVNEKDWPPARREILLTANSLNFLQLKMGSNVSVQMPNGKTYTMRVAGTVRDADEPGLPFVTGARGYVTFDTWAWLDEGRKFSTLLFRVSEKNTDREHIQQVADLIKYRVQNDGRRFDSANIPRNPDKHPANDSVQGIVALMTALGVAALLMSGFLTVNTVSAVLMQHVRQIGLMKASGARASQISRMYLGMVLSFGALSLLIAVPLGMIGARLLTQFIGETMLNLKIGDDWPPPGALAAQIGIGLLAPMMAALAPVLSGTRKTVGEALSDYGIGEAKTRTNTTAVDVWLSMGGEMRGKAVIATPAKPPRKSLIPAGLRLPRFLALSRPTLLSLQNTFRRKGRLILTLVTLVLGGAIFISVLSAREGLTKTLDLALKYWGYDIEIVLSNSYPVEQAEQAALDVPGVTRVEGWGFGRARRINSDRSESSSFSIAAPPGDTRMLKPILLRGRWLTLEDKNAIVLNTDALQNLKGVDVGDTIPIRLNSNHRVEVTVVGIVQGVLTGPLGYMNRAGYNKLAKRGSKVSFLAVASNTRDAAANTKILKAVEERLKRDNLLVSNTNLISSIRSGVTSQFDIIIYLLMVMAAVLAFVGGLGLAGTMGINVLERTREIGVMRAIGATSSAVRRIVLTEGVLIGGLSWLMGALLAVPVSYAAALLLGSALRFVVLPSFSLLGVLIWLGGVLVIAMVASILPAWNASRLTVREVLAYD
jgi:putative ABC transport system permease protein